MDGKIYLISRMLFSELYKIMVNEVTLAGFRGAIAPSPGSAPVVRLVTVESTQFDNKDSEPKAQVRLRKFPEENTIFSQTHILRSSLSFSKCQNENECFS